jgi:LmbE family N-acetylglucosaminyl deacetylase
MISFCPDQRPGAPLSVLAIGAHSDDIEIGCGAALLALAARPSVELHWVVLTASGARAEEARAAATRFAQNADLHLHLAEFRDGFLPYDPAVKEFFESLKPIRPNMIFTHRRDDAHQDHRLVHQLTWNTFRNHAIFEYEIPKYDGDLGQPNFYAPVTRAAAQQKIDILMDVFATQRSKAWFDPETFLGLMRLRGVECNAAEGLAEAFFARKLIFSVGSQMEGGVSDVQR